MIGVSTCIVYCSLWNIAVHIGCGYNNVRCHLASISTHLMGIWQNNGYTISKTFHGLYGGWRPFKRQEVHTSLVYYQHMQNELFVSEWHTTSYVIRPQWNVTPATLSIKLIPRVNLDIPFKHETRTSAFWFPFFNKLIKLRMDSLSTSMWRDFLWSHRRSKMDRAWPSTCSGNSGLASREASMASTQPENAWVDNHMNHAQRGWEWVSEC
jgi:hypothetical protein